MSRAAKTANLMRGVRGRVVSARWMRVVAADRWTRSGSATAVATVAVIAAATLTPVSSAQAAPTLPVHQAVTADVPDVAPDAVTAQINARLSHHRVEVLSERTKTRQVFINPNGIVTSETAEVPVRVKDPDGKDGWSDIDLDLRREADGSVAPKVPLFDVSLSGGGDDDSSLVQLQDSKERTISLDWAGDLPTPVLDGATATYVDVAPDVDLVVTARRFGFEESFVVKKRPADPESLELPLTVSGDGLRVKDADDSDTSGMTIVDSAGHTVGSVGRADTWDESVDKGGDPDHTTVSDLTLDKDEGATTLMVKPDTDFLNDPDTQYPVVIDPSFTVSNAGSVADTYVKSDEPGRSFSGASGLEIGTFNGAQVLRAYLRFTGMQITGKYVTSAYLKLWNYYSPSCTHANLDVFAAYNVPSNFSSLTWNSNQPWIDTSTKTSDSSARGYSSSCAAEWLTINATYSTRYFANQATDKYSYAVRASETAPSGFKRFDSSENVHVPVLEVNYDSYPEVPSGVYVLPTAPWGGWNYTSSAAPAWWGTRSIRMGSRNA